MERGCLLDTSLGSGQETMRQTLGMSWDRPGRAGEWMDGTAHNFCSLLSPSCFRYLSFTDYDAFREAAEQFQPYIKFFATFEKSVSNIKIPTNKQTNRPLSAS